MTSWSGYQTLFCVILGSQRYNVCEEKAANWKRTPRRRGERKDYILLFHLSCTIWPKLGMTFIVRLYFDENALPTICPDVSEVLRGFGAE